MNEAGPNTLKPTPLSNSKPENRWSTLARHWVWVALVIVLAFCAGIRWRLRDFPLERDEGEYAYAGQLLLQGIPPYRYAYNVKFPGAYVAYAVVMGIFGQSPAGIHTGIILVNSACGVLLFLLGRRLVSAPFGLVAAASYAVMSLGQGVLGLAGHATHFVNLFVLAGFLALLRARASHRNWPWLPAGLLFGLGVLMKQQALPIVLFAGLFVLFQQLRPQPIAWSTTLGRLGCFGLGVMLPVAANCWLLYRAGVLGRFWFWTIQYASQYGQQVPLVAGWKNFCAAFCKLAPAGVSLGVLGGLGVISILSNKALRTAAPFVLGFLASSFLATGAGLYFREHYFLLVLPAAGLLVAAAIQSVRQVLGPSNRAVCSLLATSIFLFALGWAVYAQAALFFAESPQQACRATYQQNPFIESQVIGRYIMAHCAPDKTVAVLGSEPQVYFYSHRRSATGYIYTYGLMENQPYAMQMQHEMAAEIEAARPEYVVCVGLPVSWLPRRGSSKWIVGWAARYTQEMELVALADNLPTRITYYWDTQAAGRRPESPYFMAVYRRRAGQ